MDSDEDYCGDFDYESSGDGSDNESANISHEDVMLDSTVAESPHRCAEEGKSYPFEVLTTDQILQHMDDFLNDFNTVAMVRCFIGKCFIISDSICFMLLFFSAATKSCQNATGSFSMG